MKNKLWWIEHKWLKYFIIILAVLFLVAILGIPFVLSFVSHDYGNLFETLYKSIFAIYTIILSTFIGCLLERYVFKKSNN